jgi:flagellar hook-associated protein 3 FlgL
MISGTRYRLTLEINRQMQLARDIERAQVEISTGKRIQTASDDPLGAARVSDIARAQANEATWARNLQTAAATASRADTTLSSIAALMQRANELIIAGANETLSDENRATIALELRSLAAEMESLKSTPDQRGDLLFPAGAALALPVARGVTIAPTLTREAVFETVPVASGPSELGAILVAAADALETANPTDRKLAIQQSIEAIKAGNQHVAEARGEQGARANRIDSMLERYEAWSIQLEEERSRIESADIVEVVARLQARQLTLQAAQAAFVRINQNSLFDLLR